MPRNYYTILEISADASEEEIKRSYRRLALKYHPDRNPPDDKFAELRFKEILDAYNVLSEKNRRINYDYEMAKARRNKTESEKSVTSPPQVSSVAKKAEPVTPQSILGQFTRVRKKVLNIKDKSRIRQAELFKTLNTLLGVRNIEIAQSGGDNRVPRMIIDEVFICSRYLSLEYVERLTTKMIRLAGADNEKIVEIHAFVEKSRRRAQLQKYLPMAIISAAIMIMVILISLL
jgi:curved DNA-binding protein CbpA